MKERAIVDADTVPRWGRGVRLRFDKARQVWILMAPERVLMPDGVALDIMKRIDGERTVAAVVDELAEEYLAEEDEMSREVVAFLQDLTDRGLVAI